MSIFTRKGPLITFEFMEYLQEALKSNPEATTLEILTYACNQTGRSKKDLEAIAVRLADEKVEQAAKTSDAKSSEKGFGTSFLEWYTKLSPDIMCLMATGFDYQKAEYLYRHVDKAVVGEILRAFSEHSWNEAYLRFEACLFGFGGGYGNKGSKPKGEEKVIDARDMDLNDLNALLMGGR